MINSLRVFYIEFFLFFLVLVNIVSGKFSGHHKYHGKFEPGLWYPGHATFYGDSDGSGTITGGSCGYSDTVAQGYGLQTAALSMPIYNDGLSCGACYEIMCVDDPQWCNPNNPSIFITATNYCPVNDNPPLPHFDLSQPAFGHIAQYQAGIISVSYRRFPCKKTGGIRFTITGNPYFNLILVWNVAGAGDVHQVQVKPHRLPWIKLNRNWGQNWQTGEMLIGRSLTFRVTGSDGRHSTSWHVASSDWQFGQTFEGKNFRF